MSTPTQEHPWRQSVKAAKIRKHERQYVNLTCPTCKRERALTPTEARRGYQCFDCTALEEFGL